MKASEISSSSKSVTPSEERLSAFKGTILSYYRESGRDFPWRRTRDPWDILVSEIMLQQTQTERVIPKYLSWMEAYPDPGALSKAPLAEVLNLWSGLGYNRRALALVRAAAMIEAAGRFPDGEDALRELPGVGPYTARAVLAFAYCEPVVLIETNIRSVFLHFFFENEDNVNDARLAPLIEATLDREDPRNWYYALMDYGAMLKRIIGNPNSRSAHYSKQKPFADSNRRIRGSILRELGRRGRADADDLAGVMPFARERIVKALGELKAEGFVAESCGVYRLGD
jgi:A/G-specific adenine glycosylase